ncbi:MAG: OmpA family protein [Flavobacteriales bacterium]|jgi:outer membrane protein OmpA-like peptidoglycan-associated protein|nr:OmpA family protein [Flavobacteriales bacterium]HOZ39934.1 OmpA family protein [Flavobacteriales bacterium]
MKRSLSLLFTALIAHMLIAQQVDTLRSWVVNGDFELMDGKKLKRPGGIQYAKGWSSSTSKKVDLFSEDATVESTVSTPRNFVGEQTALSGKNYAGLRWWSYQNKEPRTYLQTKLKYKMKKDSLYCVRYYVSLADLSKYATNELGAYFSKVDIVKDEDASLTYEVKVPQVRTKIYDDMFSWQGVCGVYESTGNEEWMLIGNFQATEKTDNAKTKRPRGETRAQLFSAYYYIDNVEVYPVTDRRTCTCEQLKEVESEFIFSRRGVSAPNLTAAARVDKQVFYFKRFQRVLDGSMDAWVTEMVAAMKEDPAVKVSLIGHLDATEVDRIRMRPDLASLAKERAEALRDALLEGGIEASRITVSGLDGSTPVDTTGTEVGMSKNRRVEVDLAK